MAAWNHWNHVTCNTYGTWLPGDPRGWHERKHKKHVPGDYKNSPPPGFGEGLHQYSRRMLKQEPVRLNSQQRQTVGQALIEKLSLHQIEILVFSCDAIHFHILGRFRDDRVRWWIGTAKKHAWFALRKTSFQGKLWQQESDVTPIRDRNHQVNVFRYIEDHREKGAWVWTYREGVYWQQETPLPPGLPSRGVGERRE